MTDYMVLLAAIDFLVTFLLLYLFCTMYTSFELMVTNLIGPLQSDRQTVCPITFNVLAPLCKHVLWAPNPTAMPDKSTGFRKHSDPARQVA